MSPAACGFLLLGSRSSYLSVLQSLSPYHLSPTLASWEALSKPCSPYSLGGDTRDMELGLILESPVWP